MKQIDLIQLLKNEAKQYGHRIEEDRNFLNFISKQGYLIFPYKKTRNDELEIHQSICDMYLNKLKKFRSEDSPKHSPKVSKNLEY